VTRSFTTLDSRETADGLLELRARGPGDFLLCLDGRILMNSRESRSEEALGTWTAEAVEIQRAPRVLISGLGMGITLRAALAALPADARVQVADLQPATRDWCEGPLRELCGNALADPRVAVQIGDVTDAMKKAAASELDRFHAIALDLYEGARGGSDPVFGDAGLARARASLAPGGALLRWTERRDPDFETRLGRAGFEFDRRRVGRGGRRHVLYRATAGPA
jgi:spermidine synthase